MKAKKSLPNVILIGAQKAGTTSFYNWLGQHPDVFAPAGMKEYNFFSHKEHLQLGLDWFSKSFNNHQNENIILHGYVNYIFFAESSARNIYNFNKEIKLILILRNPVDRSYSAYWDARKVGREDIKSFEDAIKKEKERLASDDSEVISSLTYLSHGYYSKQIKEYLKYFSREQMKVLFFDDMKNNPKSTIKDVFAFLDIDTYFQPNFEKKNSSGLPRSLLLQKILQKIRIPRNIKKVIPSNWTSNIRAKLIREFNVKKVVYPTMNRTTREELINLYSKEIVTLERLLNIKLNHWRA